MAVNDIGKQLSRIIVDLPKELGAKVVAGVERAVASGAELALQGVEAAEGLQRIAGASGSVVRGSLDGTAVGRARTAISGRVDYSAIVRVVKLLWDSGQRDLAAQVVHAGIDGVNLQRNTQGQFIG